MHSSNVPALAARYWAAILIASLLGTTTGDFVAKTLKLGFAGALLPLGVLLALVLILERRGSVASEVYYWVAVIIARTAATTLGDFVSDDLKLGFGWGSGVVAVGFALAFLVSRLRRARPSAAPSPDLAGAAKSLPPTTTGYWVLIVIASTLGATVGDFLAESLKLGVGLASLLLGAALALVWAFEGRARTSNDVRYWIAIIVTTAVGTTMGDLLTGKEGLNLGFRWGAASLTFLLVVVLRRMGRQHAGDFSQHPTISAAWGMAVNDVAVWLRSPAAIAASLLPALGMGVLVAMLTASVGRQPVALVVEGQGKHSARMARILLGDEDAYIMKKMSAADAEKAFGEQRVAAMIVVPENFDWAVYRSDGMVDLYLNNINIDIADDLRRAVTRSVAEFDAPQLGLLGELHGPSVGILLPNVYRVAVAEHDLRDTNVSFLQYQVIPIIVLIAISIGTLGTALLTARDFERSTVKMLVLSPAGRAALVVGRLLGGSLLTFVLIAPLVLLGFLTHGLPFCEEEAELHMPQWAVMLVSGPCGWQLPPVRWTHGVALVALLVAVTLMTVGLGTLLGIVLRDLRVVTMTALNAAAYLFFLGGGFTMVAFLPHWLQVASRFVPTSYAIEGLRQALFYPDLRGVGHDLLVLTGCAALSIVLASATLTRVWRRA